MRKNLLKRISTVLLAVLMVCTAVVPSRDVAAAESYVTVASGGSFRTSMLVAVKRAEDESFTGTSIESSEENSLAAEIKSVEPAATVPSDITSNREWVTVATSDRSDNKTGAYINFNKETGTISYASNNGAILYLAVNENQMFAELPNLTSVNLEGFNTSKTQSINGMFLSDAKLSTVKGLNFQNLISANELFVGCKTMKEIDLTGINTSSMDNYGLTFLFGTANQSEKASVEKFTVGPTFRFISRTGISGNWKKSGTNDVWTAEQLELLYDGTSTAAGIPNAGTYEQTQDAATTPDMQKEKTGEYYEASPVTPSSSIKNLYNVENPDEDARITGYCIDEALTDSETGETLPGGRPLYGYYRKVELTDSSKLVNGVVVKRPNNNYADTKISSSILDNTKGYLNTDNYGASPLSKNNDMLEALKALVYWGPQIYGTNGKITTYAQYLSLQGAIWHFTNNYSETWADASKWEGKTYETIPETVKKSLKLYVYVSESGVQNLITCEFTGPFPVTIAKYSSVGSRVAGATLELTGKDSEGNNIKKTFDKTVITTATDTSGETTTRYNGVVTAEVNPGTYTVTELDEVPAGYVKASPITFKVDETGNVKIGNHTLDKHYNSNGKLTAYGVIVLVDDYKTGITIRKVDDDEKPLNGATFKLSGTIDNQLVQGEYKGVQKNVTFAEETLSGKSEYTLDLQPGTYTLTEYSAPNGYKKSDETIKFTVVVKENSNYVPVTTVTSTSSSVSGKVITVKNTKLPTGELSVIKVDDDGNKVEGAEFKLTKDNDSTFAAETWNTTSENPHKITGLSAGSYTIEETKVPDGYQTQGGTKVTFTVADDGTVVGGNVKDGTITVVNSQKTYSVAVSKQDIAGAEIQGAHLEILDHNGKLVDQWDSVSNNSHYSNLTAGKYTLIETTSPKGYAKAEKIDFTVNADGSVESKQYEDGKIVMTDNYAEGDVVISKQDLAGKEIAGAELKILDSDKNEIESWTSEENKSHEVTLRSGTYTLVETTSPDGYAKSEDITFTVNDDGTVTSDNYKDGKVVMTDKYEVTIRKTNIEGEDIAGATMRIIGRESGKTENITPIEWITQKLGNDEDGGYTVALNPGSYTVHEKTAPSGYNYADDLSFILLANGKIRYDGKIIDSRTLTLVDTYKTGVVISKVNENGQALAGASLKLTGTQKRKKEQGVDANVRANIDITELFEQDELEWISTDDETKVKTIDLQPGTYTLTEVSAPNKYRVADPIIFTVSVDSEGSTPKVTIKDNYENTVKKIVMKDTIKPVAGTVEVSKQNVVHAEIEGATLVISGNETDTGNAVRKEWTTKKGMSHTEELNPGTYTLTETGVPEGYKAAAAISFTIGMDGKIEDENAFPNNRIVMTDEDTTRDITFKKTDIAGNEIEGASLTITGKERGSDTNIESISWKSVKGEDHVVSLKPGDYTLTETQAPDGYEKAESIDFTVNGDGTITADNQSGSTIVMKDEQSPIKVPFSKVNVAGKELEGAVITVSGKTADGRDFSAKYTSDGTQHEIDLLPGTYTMTEETAPDGYKKAESVSFTVNTDNTITVGGTPGAKAVTMIDDLDTREVEVSKQDSSGKEISGAQIKITGENVAGQKLTDISYTTDGKTHKFNFQPGTYVMEEVTAPSGYEKADSISFRVRKDMKLYVNGKEVNKLVMVDEEKGNKFSVKLSKTGIDNNELAGASLVVSHVKSDGTTIADAEWTSTGVVKEVKLAPGTYTYHEAKAPDGYIAAADIEFKVGDDGKVTVNGSEAANATVTMADKYTSVTVKKMTTDGKLLAGASLQILKEDGTKVAEWTSEETERTINGILAAGGRYVLHEEKAPDGYKRAADQAFTVNSDGSNQVIEMRDEKGVDDASNTAAGASSSSDDGTSSANGSSDEVDSLLPATGDVMFPFIGVGCLGLLAVMIFLIVKKRKNSR